MKLWDYIERKPASPRQAHLLGITLMVLSSFAWAILERAPSMVPPAYLPYELVWMRYATHLLLMAALLGARERQAVVRTPKLRTHIIRSLLMFGMPVLFIAAIRRHAPVNFVWSMTWVAVPIAIATAAWCYRERASAGLWATALVGLAGAWLVLGSPRPNSALDMLLAIGVALCYGFYIAMTRDLRSEQTGTNLFHTALWVFLVLTLIVPFVWLPLSLPLVLVMIGVGIGGFTVLLLLDRALACAPVAVVAPFAYTETIWGFASEWLRHGRQPSSVEWLGVGLIAATCIWVVVHVLLKTSLQPAGEPVLAR